MRAMLVGGATGIRIVPNDRLAAAASTSDSHARQSDCPSVQMAEKNSAYMLLEPALSIARSASNGSSSRGRVTTTVVIPYASVRSATT
jgi:hypothetical protein